MSRSFFEMLTIIQILRLDSYFRMKIKINVVININRRELDIERKKLQACQTRVSVVQTLSEVSKKIILLSTLEWEYLLLFTENRQVSLYAKEQVANERVVPFPHCSL